MNLDRTIMSDADFASLGGRHFAYVREMTNEEAAEIANLTGLPVAGVKLFALHAADGTRMTVTDSFDTARASALELDLETVSVH